jgi:hypothetical protein
VPFERSPPLVCLQAPRARAAARAGEGRLLHPGAQGRQCLKASARPAANHRGCGEPLTGPPLALGMPKADMVQGVLFNQLAVWIVRSSKFDKRLLTGCRGTGKKSNRIVCGWCQTPALVRNLDTGAVREVFQLRERSSLSQVSRL